MPTLRKWVHPRSGDDYYYEKKNASRSDIQRASRMKGDITVSSRGKGECTPKHWLKKHK